METVKGESSTAAAAEENYVNLKVTNQTGDFINFKIKKMATFKKLMSIYCERTGINPDAVRFSFDGRRVVKEDTPSSLEMEDGDSIDVFQPQEGGQ